VPAFKPEAFVIEESPATGSTERLRTLWISQSGGLTQFGAFIEVLQPGSRSSIKPIWPAIRPTDPVDDRAA